MVNNHQPPLVAILGPTASGKSALAMDLASVYSGEIICSDSRTIYKDMNIGTAKPSRADQAKVPHWGLDIVEPGQRFTAYQFKQYAVEKIVEIRSRGNTPMLVGGTGLYIDSVVFDFQFDEVDEATRRKQTLLRQQLDNLSTQELQLRLLKAGHPLPTNSQNRRHLIQAILRDGRKMKAASRPIANTYIAGLSVDEALIKQRIKKRIENMFDQGLVEETEKLAQTYGWENEAMTGNIYPVVRRLINNDITMRQAIEEAARIDWQLVRRQRTWFKRNKYINWFNPENAYENLVQVLDTFSEA